MKPAAMYNARQNGATFAELARVSGLPEKEVRAHVAVCKAALTLVAAEATPINGHDHMKPNEPTEAGAADISLEAIAEEVNREHRLATEVACTALEHATRCGELLKKAKAQVGRGNFLPWLKANFAGSERTARNYMRLCTNRQHVADSYTNSIRTALKLTDQQSGPMERAKNAWRANPELSVRALVKKENIGHGTAQKAREQLIAAGEIAPRAPNPKTQKTASPQPKAKPTIAPIETGGGSNTDMLGAKLKAFWGHYGNTLLSADTVTALFNEFYAIANLGTLSIAKETWATVRKELKLNTKPDFFIRLPKK